MPRRKKQTAAAAVIVLNADRICRDDTVVFNVRATDLYKETDRTIGALRLNLTRGNQLCAGVPITRLNSKHPFVKLVIVENMDDKIKRQTALIIQKIDCYAYAFFANKKWRVCKDFKVVLLHSRSLPYPSSYKEPVGQIGPGAILNALSVFSTDDVYEWRKSFLQLVFMFLESSRFESIATFVKNTMKHNEQEDIFNCYHKIDDVTSSYTEFWGKISVALQDFFQSRRGKPAIWKLDGDIVAALKLPAITENGNSPEQKKIREEQTQAQIQACLAFMRIIKNRD